MALYIFRRLVCLGLSLNLSVIAEGVETEAQRDFLMAEGCHLYQGYLYSPAVPAWKLEALVAASTVGHRRLAFTDSLRRGLLQS